MFARDRRGTAPLHRLAAVLGDLVVLTAYLVGALVSTVAARRAGVWTPSRIKPELSL